MTEQLTDKKRVRTLKKVVSRYRKGVREILARSERILERWPDSVTAARNMEDCEALLRMEKTLYRRLKREIDHRDPSQKRLEELRS